MSSSEKEFLEKIEKRKGVVFKISKMYINNKDDQNDLYQEIIYQAWKSYDDFQKRSDFSTWLYRTALNTAIVFLMRSMSDPNSAHSLVGSPQPDTYQGTYWADTAGPYTEANDNGGVHINSGVGNYGSISFHKGAQELMILEMPTMFQGLPLKKLKKSSIEPL